MAPQYLIPSHKKGQALESLRDVLLHSLDHIHDSKGLHATLNILQILFHQITNIELSIDNGSSTLHILQGI